MTAPDDSNGATVRITLRDVYNLVQDVQKDLSKAVGGIEAHVQQPAHSGTSAELNDHESRIRKLEKVAWMAVGIAMVASAMAGYVLSQVG